MKYGLFGTELDQIILFKNATYKTVAALFSDIERKICEVCAFPYFLQQNSTSEKSALKDRSCSI